MNINSKEYLEEQLDCVDRNFLHAQQVAAKVRYSYINKYCYGAKKILDVGSGGAEPVFIGATHACDIAPNAEKYLKSLGWNGKFKVASCTKLPYPDKFFDVAVCCEVIEHLPTIDDVKKTFFELERVAKRWLLTTPNCKIPEPTHKHIFTLKILRAILKKFQVYIYRKGIHFYVEKKNGGVSLQGIQPQNRKRPLHIGNLLLSRVVCTPHIQVSQRHENPVKAVPLIDL